MPDQTARAQPDDIVPRAADDPEQPAGIDGEWFSIENDLVLAPA